ncbi:MAG: MBL fold metallo-hydrolase [Hyphomonadaceae bacterium]|nr:MBL fold metallo-hydrolase [Hyphomonadaceae bacterium]MBC6412275.1 MBL fold metallo-hydrolase [Hyphomonadaceae bacterium]
MNESGETGLDLRVIPVTPFQQNCTLAWDRATMEGVLVDPGGEADKLMSTAGELGVTLREMWLTHGHLDHAGGAKDIRDALGIPIIGPHRDDQFWLDLIEESWALYGHAGQGKNVTPDRYLEDKETLTLGNYDFTVLHTPGHTPGHVIIYSRTLKITFVGDVLFRGSIGRTDFPKSNHQDLLNSITDKLWPLGGDMRFIPGHGPMSTFGAERADNPFVGDAVITRSKPRASGIM